MNRNFIPIFLAGLFFSLDAMEVPSLLTICISPAAHYFYDNFNLDEPLFKEVKRIKGTLESLPDSLQEKVIERIDFMLCPQWQEVTRSLHERYYLHSLTKYKSCHFGCNSLGFFVHDSENKITYQKNNQDRNDPIQYIERVPNIALLLGISEQAISFFSSEIPLRFLGKKELNEEKDCVISTDKKPVVYIATRHKILTFPCDGIKDQTSIESQSLAELSFFNNRIKSVDNPIKSLALTHDNQFLYVGCEKKPSYKICLASKMVEEISEEKIDRIIIADDDSIVAIAEHHTKKTKIMAKKEIPEKEESIDGIVLCIKNNVVITSGQYGDLLGYDIHGKLLKKFTIRSSLGDNPCYFVADQNNFPSFINVDYESKDQQVDIFCVPEKLTIDSVYKLAFKLAVEKAIDHNRKDILTRLLSDEATLSSFPQPDILRYRIQEKLDEKGPDNARRKRCIIS